MFKLFVQHGDLVTNFAKLFCVVQDAQGCATNDYDYHKCADARDKPKPSGVGALFSDARCEPFVGVHDDPRDKNIGLVTEGFAIVGSKDSKDVLVALVSL